jgi:hypothetical protein
MGYYDQPDAPEEGAVEGVTLHVEEDGRVLLEVEGYVYSPYADGRRGWVALFTLSGDCVDATIPDDADESAQHAMDDVAYALQHNTAHLLAAWGANVRAIL